MANFNFGIPTSSGLNFYFGTTCTGIEVSFNFIEDSYGYNDYDFNFGIIAAVSGTSNLGAVICAIPFVDLPASISGSPTEFTSETLNLGSIISSVPPVDLLVEVYGISSENLSALVVAKAWAKQLVIKSTVTPGYNINSINVENVSGEDILYVNTVSGIVRTFSSCSGTILDRSIISSDLVSGTCQDEKLFAGCGNELLEIDVSSDTYDTFILDGEVVKVLYYIW